MAKSMTNTNPKQKPIPLPNPNIASWRVAVVSAMTEVRRYMAAPKAFNGGMHRIFTAKKTQRGK